jgi:hypothetical protein
MNVLVIIIIVVIGVVIYKRNTPDAKEKRAAKKAYLDAATRRAVQYQDLNEHNRDNNIFFKEYSTFRYNGESVSDYFNRVSFSSLPTEVKLWYYR